MTTVTNILRIASMANTTASLVKYLMGSLNNDHELISNGSFLKSSLSLSTNDRDGFEGSLLDVAFPELTAGLEKLNLDNENVLGYPVLGVRPAFTLGPIKKEMKIEWFTPKEAEVFWTAAEIAKLSRFGEEGYERNMDIYMPKDLYDALGYRAYEAIKRIGTAYKIAPKVDLNWFDGDDFVAPTTRVGHLESMDWRVIQATKNEKPSYIVTVADLILISMRALKTPAFWTSNPSLLLRLDDMTAEVVSTLNQLYRRTHKTPNHLTAISALTEMFDLLSAVSEMTS
jgi:hypothetical protein